MRAQQVQGLNFSSAIQSSSGVPLPSRPPTPPPLPGKSQPKRPPPLPGPPQPSRPSVPINRDSSPSAAPIPIPTRASDETGRVSNIFASRKAVYILAGSGGGLLALIALIAVAVSLRTRAEHRPAEALAPRRNRSDGKQRRGSNACRSRVCPKKDPRNESPPATSRSVGTTGNGFNHRRSIAFVRFIFGKCEPSVAESRSSKLAASDRRTGGPGCRPTSDSRPEHVFPSWHDSRANSPT